MPAIGQGSSEAATTAGSRRSTYRRASRKYVPPTKPPIITTGSIPYSQPGPTAGGGQQQSVGTPSRPKPPNESQFLRHDVGYQQALREFKLNYQNFLGDQGRQKSQAKTQFGQQRTQLGTQRERDLKDIEGDFASRGLLQSGLYAGRLGEYEKDFASNLTSYQTAYDDFLRQLASAQQQLQSQQQLESERARQEALARRAGRYGL